MSAPDLFNNVLEVLAIAIREKRKEAGKEKKNRGERERERTNWKGKRKFSKTILSSAIVNINQ